MDRYHEYVNYIVDGDDLIVVGVKVSPRVAKSLHDCDDETWETYLRMVDDAVRKYPSMPDLFPF